MTDGWAFNSIMKRSFTVLFPLCLRVPLSDLSSVSGTAFFKFLPLEIRDGWINFRGRSDNNLLCCALSRIVNRIIIECNKIFSNDESKRKNSKVEWINCWNGSFAIQHAVLAHLYSRLVLLPSDGDSVPQRLKYNNLLWLSVGWALRCRVGLFQ